MTKKQQNPWITVIYAVVMQAVSIGIAVYSFAFFLLPWANEFGVSRTLLIAGATLQSIAVAALSPLCGYLLDTVRTRQLLLSSVTLFALGLLGISMAPNALILVAIVGLVLPIGVTLAGPLMAYSLVARTEIEKKGLALGITALGTSLGGFILPLVVTQLLLDHDWRSVFLGLSALTMLVVFLPGLWLLEANPTTAKPRTEKSTNLALMRSPDVLQLGLCYLIPAILFIAVLHNIGAIAADLKIEAQRAALITSGASVLMAIGKVLSGAMSDRWNSKTLYSGIVVFMLAGALTTGFAAGFSTLIIGVSLVAFGLGGVAPLTAAIVTKRWDASNFGRVMGVIHAMAACAGLGPLLAGYIRESTGSYTYAFTALALCLLVAWVLFMRLPSTQATAPD
jgi:MFS family permease